VRKKPLTGFERPKVELKPLPPGAFSATDPVNEWGKTQWEEELLARLADAVWGIAEGRGAEFFELMKVAPLLVDFVETDTRGRRRKVTREVMTKVAAAVERGVPQSTAAELQGVSVRTIQRERRRQK